MSNFEQTKTFEKVKIECIDCNTGETHHLKLTFKGWQTLAKFINYLEKRNKWKTIKIEKE